MDRWRMDTQMIKPGNRLSYNLVYKSFDMKYNYIQHNYLTDRAFTILIIIKANKTDHRFPLTINLLG